MKDRQVGFFAASAALTIAVGVWSVLATSPELTRVLIVMQALLIVSATFIAIYLLQRHRSEHTLLGLGTLLNERRAGREFEYEFIAASRRSLTLVGIIHRTFWADRSRFDDVLHAAVCNGAEINVFFVHPDSRHLAQRASEEGEDPEDWANQIRQSARLFLDFARRHPDATVNLWCYDQYPVWHLVIRDERNALVGWYPPAKHSYNAPLYACSLDAENGLAVPAIQWLAAIRRDASPFESAGRAQHVEAPLEGGAGIDS